MATFILIVVLCVFVAAVVYMMEKERKSNESFQQANQKFLELIEEQINQLKEEKKETK